MISQLSSCGPSFSATPHGKLPLKSHTKVWGEHLKIKKLTFLINGVEVAGVMVAQPLLKLFQPLLLQSVDPITCVSLGAWGPHQTDPSEGCRALPSAGLCGCVATVSALDFKGCIWEVLPCIWALGAGCGAAQRPLAGLWMGLALPQTGMVPAASLHSGAPALVHNERS